MRAAVAARELPFSFAREHSARDLRGRRHRAQREFDCVFEGFSAAEQAVGRAGGRDCELVLPRLLEQWSR
jgi:hypothetical protein